MREERIGQEPQVMKEGGEEERDGEKEKSRGWMERENKR